MRAASSLHQQAHRQHAAVTARPGRGQFIGMDMHFAARKIANPTYMIVMQMTDEPDINIG